MSNWPITIKGEGNKTGFLILQSLFNFSYLVLLATLVMSLKQGDYRVSVEVLVLAVLAFMFFKRTILKKHGFENVRIEKKVISHRIYRWFFSKTSQIPKKDIKKVRVVNIREDDKLSTPDYFSDYRVELELVDKPNYYIGNFITKKQADQLAKKLS